MKSLLFVEYQFSWFSNLIKQPFNHQWIDMPFVFQYSLFNEHKVGKLYMYKHLIFFIWRSNQKEGLANTNIDIKFSTTTRFWNSLHQVQNVCSKQKYLKANYYKKKLQARKPKGLNRIAKIGYGYLCLREEYLSFKHGTNIDHYYMTINISFIWLAKNMRFFLDKTLWILFKPSISAKINLDCSRGAFGTLY